MKKWEIWEVKNLIPEYQKKYNDYKNTIEWNNTLLLNWEYNLLVHIGAIDALGILNNYPLLKVGDSYQDYDGDVSLIKQKVDEINTDSRIKNKAEISFCPRGYSIWTEIQKEKAEKEAAQKRAKENNSVPLEAYEEINNFKINELSF